MNNYNKKYWKILNTPDIENCLIHLNAPQEYIKVLLEEDSDFDKYIKKPNKKYVFIVKDDTNTYGQILSFNGFGWGEDVDEDFFIKYNYKYMGLITLRKQKLQILKTISTQSELCSDKN